MKKILFHIIIIQCSCVSLASAQNVDSLLNEVQRKLITDTNSLKTFSNLAECYSYNDSTICFEQFVDDYNAGNPLVRLFDQSLLINFLYNRNQDISIKALYLSFIKERTNYNWHIGKETIAEWFQMYLYSDLILPNTK